MTAKLRKPVTMGSFSAVQTHAALAFLLCLGTVHLLLCVYDLYQYRLPDWLVITAWILTIGRTFLITTASATALIAICVLVSAGACALSFVSPASFGLGDAKLIGALLLVTSAESLTAVWFQLVCICIVTLAWAIWTAERKLLAFPLAPSLILGTWGALAFV